MKKVFLLMFSLLIFVNPFLNVKAEEPEDEITVVCDEDNNHNEFCKYNDYYMYKLDAYSLGQFDDYFDYFFPFRAIKKEEADYGLRYILDNGYLNKNLTGDEYSFTGSAILWYMIDMGYVDVNGEFKNYYNSLKTEYTDYLNYMQEAYNKACVDNDWTEIEVPEEQRENVCSLFKQTANIFNASELQKEYEKNYTGEIILSDSSSKLTKSEGGKYYETNWLSIKRSDANKYNVELTNAPKGTIIIDKDGNEKTEFNITDEFKIKVPVDNVKDNQISFKINIDDTYNTYYIYKSIDKDPPYHHPVSSKTMSLDDHYVNMVYSKPYPKQIKESKEFYLDIDAEIPSQIVIVPPTSAYASVIIASLGIICVIISIFIMRKIIKKES